MPVPVDRPCRHCGSTAGDVVLDLGLQPSAEVFPPASTDHHDDPRHPLRMWLCAACDLAQLVEDPGTVEEQTVVVESQAMQQQSEDTLAYAADHGVLRPGLRVAEHGSPHGHPLDDRLRARGLTPVGTDEPADVVLDVYGLLHEPDQERALGTRLAQLPPDGALVLQLHTLASAVATGQFAELRHGHFAYWSLPALDAALRRRGWGVHRARRFAMDAGTLTVVATAAPAPDDETRALLAAETAAGVADPHAVAALQRAADAAHALRAWLEAERAEGRRVVGYGAAGRAVPLLCHAGLDASLLPAIGDAAPTKRGRRMPGTDIAIFPPYELVAGRPDRVLLFLPDLLPEVRRALPEVEASGGRWVVLDPTPRVVTP